MKKPWLEIELNVADDTVDKAGLQEHLRKEALLALFADRERLAFMELLRQRGSLQHFRGSTICFAHGVIKKTIWDLAVGNGPGRRCCPHSGSFLFADHLSHPRR